MVIFRVADHPRTTLAARLGVMRIERWCPSLQGDVKLGARRVGPGRVICTGSQGRNLVRGSERLDHHVSYCKHEANKTIGAEERIRPPPNSSDRIKSTTCSNCRINTESDDLSISSLFFLKVSLLPDRNRHQTDTKSEFRGMAGQREASALDLRVCTMSHRPHSRRLSSELPVYIPMRDIPMCPNTISARQLLARGRARRRPRDWRLDQEFDEWSGSHG